MSLERKEKDGRGRQHESGSRIKPNEDVTADDNHGELASQNPKTVTKSSERTTDSPDNTAWDATPGPNTLEDVEIDTSYAPDALSGTGI